MTVSVRGIYATALTELLDDVVYPSAAIAERFDTSFPVEAPAIVIETTADRQGVWVAGPPEPTQAITTTLADVAIDAMSWSAALPRDGVFDGEVLETLGGGAVVDCGPGEGYLPYERTEAHITDGDRLRVQVDTPSAPWVGDRPTLRTDIVVSGSLLSVVRGRNAAGAQPDYGDIVPADPPDGWGVRWHAADDEAVDLSTLGAALDHAAVRAEAIDDALDASPAPSVDEPGSIWTGTETRFVWFGRESRFALDEIRRTVTSTMPGHHRIKAGADAAGAAVDFVEAVCASPGMEGAFPFEPLTRQFGPTAGETVRLEHGKPAGQTIVLGQAEVSDCRPDGTVTLRREMTPGGTYDGLDVERQAGDVAVTKVREGRWWYPTVYRSDAGDRRGTYVNVCTPVEVFPDAVRYVDLHVDVLKHADGTIERVDDDELDEAVDAGLVSQSLAEKARAVASAVESAL